MSKKPRRNRKRTTKICPKCHIRKPVSDFPKWHKHREGHDFARCKSCHSKKSYEYRHMTLEGYIKQLWLSIKKRSEHDPIYKKRGLFFSREEFILWAHEKKNYSKLKRVHKAFVKSGDHADAPSIDRIKNKIGYKLDNIQVLKWKKHIKKTKLDRLEEKLKKNR